MKRYLLRILSSYFGKSMVPFWMLLIIDSLIVLFSFILSYGFVYGVSELLENPWNVLGLGILFLPGFLLGFRIFHTYHGVLRFTTSKDLTHIASAISIGTLIALILHYGKAWFDESGFNVRSFVILSSCLVSFFLCISFRLLVKLLYGYINSSSDTVCRSFIFGAREGAISIALGILNDSDSRFRICGFVSDEKKLVRHRLIGSPVYEHNRDIMDIMKREKIKAVFVSPLYKKRFFDDTELTDAIIKEKIKIYLQPQEQEWDGQSNIDFQHLREVEIEDLLPRDKIEIDLNAVAAMLVGKSVLVTGAAGSIGYEMVRQIAKFSPRRLVLIDQAETPMHVVRTHMAKHYPNVPCLTIVSSITNQTRMETIFREAKPDYVFHAAAYKHVPMMEDNPSEAVQNNIYGTRVIADLSVKYGVKKFVMISTDKAVNPTNVMGCSKRICEIYCQSLNQAIQEGKVDGITQFITTRFGNVLGSNGSVIPIFQKQIKQGGPVTVTDPKIIRFFMLIPEACRLVLEAGTMGHGGEIYVFDMGKPVRIADLAQRMIDLSGAENVKIEFTGLREGEKLYEEVLSDAENTQPTLHPKIMVASVREYDYEMAKKNEEDLLQISQTYDSFKIVAKMKEIVPEYISQNSPYHVLDK